MSVELTGRAVDAGADRLLEPCALRGGLPRPVDLAPRRQPPAGPAAAARGLRGHRLLGLAQRRSCPATRSPLMPKPRAISSGSACSTACRPPATSGSTASGWSMARSPPCSASSSSSPLCAISSRRRHRGDRDPAPHHRGCRLARPRPQPLRPGLAGEPVEHPAGDARAVADLELRPQPLHDRLSRQPAGAGPARLARRDRRRHRPDVRARRQSRGRLADPAVARGDLPVALAARDLRLLRPDGDPRHRASRHQRRMVARPPGRPARGDDRRGNGPAAQRQGAQLGQGEDLQAFVRASLRLSHRMAALHRAPSA